MAGVDGAVLHGAEPLLDAGAGGSGDLLHAGFDGLHVDADFAFEDHSVEGGATCHVGGVGAGDEGFGGDAAGVDAGPAEELALDHGDLHAGPGEASCEGWAGLACADDDCVECGHDGSLLFGCDLSVGCQRARKTMRRPPLMAMASSRRAAGRSLPKALARAPRTEAPPRVPATAPMAPATRPRPID